MLINSWLIVGKLGQGMRSCKCTSNDLYVVCASDTMLSACMPRCVCARVSFILLSGVKCQDVEQLFNRKYEIVDGVEQFKKWKGRLAVIGCTIDSGIGYQ